MSRQRVLGATLVWLAVVATVSALVWVVISRAGDDLVASDRPLMTTSDGSTPDSARTPSARPSRTPSRSPSPTPSRSPSSRPTSSSAPTATSSPSTAPTPSASPSTAPSSTPSGTPSGTPSTQPPSSPTEQSSTPSTEQRTWQGQPGSIVVSCGATGIRLVSLEPVSGFRAEVHREDGRVDVEFEGREDESGLHVSVTARCVGGVPSFDAQSERDD